MRKTRDVLQRLLKLLHALRQPRESDDADKAEWLITRRLCEKRTMSRELEQYANTYGALEGFIMPQTTAIWDFLLTQQRNLGIVGDFLEIGVLKGKSALLAALYLQLGELALLVDVNEMDSVRDEIARLSIESRAFRGKSSALKMSEQFSDRVGKVRWLHIDGGHSGYSTYNDLCLAEEFISDLGIICADDFFNPRYPQLTGAIFKFLFDRLFSFKMVLCGMNKCYIVHSEAYPLYEDLIRKHMAEHIRATGFSLTISKTGFAHDMGVFGRPRIESFDYIGPDDDLTNVVLTTIPQKDWSMFTPSRHKNTRPTDKRRLLPHRRLPVLDAVFKCCYEPGTSYYGLGQQLAL